MAKTISAGALSREIAEMLEDYVDEIADGTDAAADKVSAKCLKEIKAGSPVKTGAYKKGWTRKRTGTDRGKAAYTIHNRHPGKPHLLENGHAKVGGGRVPGHPHIAPAAERAVEQMRKEVGEVVRNAGH